MKKIILSVMTLFLVSCNGGSKSPNPNNAFDLNFSNLKPYVSNGPYANVLKDCVSVTKSKDSCLLDTLPPIGLANNFPDDKAILQHLVVSHRWMGDRFAEYLTRIPDSLRYLLRATTAIVIDADIRPAYYQDLTGAIYIDPAFLWQTVSEKQSINPKQDFRSNFGKDLQFKRTWRYIINNQYAWKSFSLTDNQQRTLDDTVIHMSWLLMHELAHANDCISPNNYQNLVGNQSFYQNSVNQKNSQQCLYQQLTATNPLQSQIWAALAQVLFAGQASTSSQRAMSPEDVGLEFASDLANDTYNYSSVREDLAMNFEEVLMNYEYGAKRDVVILPIYETFDCQTALIKWGQRGRIGDLLVKPRAQFTVDNIIPEIDLAPLLAAIAVPFQMPLNESYCRTDYSANGNKAGKYQRLDSFKMQQRLENKLEIE